MPSTIKRRSEGLKLLVAVPLFSLMFRNAGYIMRFNAPYE